MCEESDALSKQVAKRNSKKQEKCIFHNRVCIFLIPNVHLCFRQSSKG